MLCYYLICYFFNSETNIILSVAVIENDRIAAHVHLYAVFIAWQSKGKYLILDDGKIVAGICLRGLKMIDGGR